MNAANVMSTPLRYLDKALNGLRDLGLMPEKPDEMPAVDDFEAGLLDRGYRVRGERKTRDARDFDDLNRGLWEDAREAIDQARRAARKASRTATRKARESARLAAGSSATAERAAAKAKARAAAARKRASREYAEKVARKIERKRKARKKVRKSNGG